MAALPLPLVSALRPTPLAHADYPRYRALYADPRVAAPTGLPALADEAEARRWFHAALALAPEQGRIMALRLGGQGALAGVLRLTDWDRGAGVLTLGYALSPEWWGRGLMRECLAEVLPWLFDGGLGAPLHRIQGWVLSDNHPSRRLLAKLGFTHEGTLRGVFRHGASRHDVCAYGLLIGDRSAAMPAHQTAYAPDGGASTTESPKPEPFCQSRSHPHPSHSSPMQGAQRS
ncbi:hypothetical protein BUE93_13780 [Chromobacterium amazonense]|uniref:N-acetyltransferase domain-containing protein n=1 Tax=Chromobacterium amazonense TaxID=1382803 RepID=A0A2S9X209_9NEIS|nr:GNAT family protein [Chromobacterium amazonense]PRP69759.1 hypothetical protein BUE93_13780 [Chromobacterium amazonense]